MGLRGALAQRKLNGFGGFAMHKKCNHCSGRGVVADTHHCYRVFSKYQDTGWIEPQEFPTLDLARLYKASNGDDSRMMRIVDPKGCVVD